MFPRARSGFIPGNLPEMKPDQGDRSIGFVPGEGVSVALDHYDVRPARAQISAMPNPSATAPRPIRSIRAPRLAKQRLRAGKVYVRAIRLSERGGIGGEYDWRERKSTI